MSGGLQSHLVSALADRVTEHLQSRGAGHCLQIAHVPGDLANDCCKEVHRVLREPDLARVVVARPSKPWQASPAKIVEVRNAIEETRGRLALFVPAGQHVAAEDSFGRSTFEVLPTDDLYESVTLRLRRALEVVAPDIAERAAEVLAAAGQDGGLSQRDVGSYLARLVEKPSEEEVGRGLVELGLLPDLGVAGEGPSDLGPRLHRNRQQVEALTSPEPPADRVQLINVPAGSPESEQMNRALLDALADGSGDPKEVTKRIEELAPSLDFGPVVAPSTDRAVVDEVAVLTLAGDFVKGSDPPTVKKAKASIRTRARCKPAARTLVGLKELQLELMQVSEQGTELVPAGVELTKKGNSLPKSQEFSWTMKIDAESIDAGLYRLRLRAFDEDNLNVGEGVSDTFRIHEELEEPEIDSLPTMSLAAARVEARCRDRRDPGAAIVSASTEQLTPTLGLAIRFSDARGRAHLELSRLLSRIERYTLDDPTLVGRRISLSEHDFNLDTANSPDRIPQGFMDARAEVFEAIKRHQYTVEGEEVGPLVALCDLTALEEPIRRYVEEWADALRNDDPDVVRDLLRIDQVTFDEEEASRTVMVGPTHPLRLAWLWRYQTVLKEWSPRDETCEAEVAELVQLLPSLLPSNIPHVLIGQQTELRYLEPMDLHWGLWAPPSQPDATGLAAGLREQLGLPRTNAGVVDVNDIVLRIRRYLAAHPYVDVIKLNFVQPGLADVVLETLLALQGDPTTAELRYEVRLFATNLVRTELGRALDEFMADPDAIKGVRRDAADAFLSSAEDPLAPKLIYSKHAVDDLLEDPGRFPAHISIFLDWFELDAVPVAPLSDRRSFFAGGLVVDPVVVYRPGGPDLSPQWDEHVPVPADAHWFGTGYADCEHATSSLLGPRAEGTVPAIRLELNRVRRSVLDAVHAKSDWVVVIDPVFTEEYLDAPPEAAGAPRYLIDSSDLGSLEANRRIMVSTRSRVELSALVRPVFDRYQLEIPEDRVGVLLDALQALNAGLPLKLLNNRTQAIEAVTLALATTYLADQGVLRRALAIPLDMHTDLFRERRPSTVDDLDLRRTDLAVVQIDPQRRHLAAHLVEVKARAGLGEKTPVDLVDQIAGQLRNSERVLRSRLFSKELRAASGSLAGALMVRRLTRLLARYAERGVRYGFMDPSRAAAARDFISDLDRSFTVSFDKHGLIFDLSGGSQVAETFDEVTIKRIGIVEITDMVARTQTPVGTQVPRGEVEDVGTVFGATRPSTVEEMEASSPEPPPLTKVEPDPEQGPVDPPEMESEPAEVEGPRAEDVLIAGSTQHSQQFGVVGRLQGARPVAFDVDGSNVASVFGVQGSGKSYTVGNLIEAGLVRNGKLNRLPKPLAGVVFHYSTNETYKPEFAEMSKPNDRAPEVDVLADEYGSLPEGVDDVRILVPADLLEERTEEFPGLEVSPLLLGPHELHVDDWKLLMGVAGGDQLYVKALTNIFRQLRKDLSVRTLRKAIKDSRLNPQQRNLADQRLDFVETFVSDEAALSPLVAPGRLLVIDVRDPLLGDDDALSLFMVLLRLFSQTGGPETEQEFNKLIVFDEAHKYMDNPRLTSAIVETVREMRHRGTSVVIASQNPPSVPREVIELSTVIVAHRFTAPTWLEHIRKVNDSFGRDLKPARLATLEPGEAFVWSGGGAEELRRPQRVRMRPRLSRHGGATRRATND